MMLMVYIFSDGVGTIVSVCGDCSVKLPMTLGFDGYYWVMTYIIYLFLYKD